MTNYLDKSRQPWRNYIALVVVLALLTLCAILLSRIDKRFVLSIDSISLNNKTAFTVGAGSDLAFKTVPHDYMTIQYETNSFKWNIDPSRDSLCYFMVNGKNPNNRSVSRDSHVHIENVGEEQLDFDFTGEQIIECVRQFEDTEYSLLRNVVALLGDSTAQQVMDDHSFSSLIVKNKKTDAVSLIVLDTHTTIDGEGYSFSGTTEELTPDNKGVCKIQFFAVRDFSVKYSEVDEDMFNIGQLNYMVKPVLLATEWGAGHFLLKPGDNSSMEIKYPKGLMYVEKTDTLRKMAELQSGLITFKQFSNNPPLVNNIYLPTFCGAANSDICNLHFKKNDILLKSNRGDSLSVSSHFSFVPTLNQASFNSEAYVLNCRYGIIDGKYIFSFVLAPFAMLIFILITFSWLIQRKNIKKLRQVSIQANIFPTYFIVIASIAFTYCIGKLMIALKLSYTYPYFEKLTGIIVVATSLFLLLFYLISLLLNYDFVGEVAHLQKKKLRKVFLSFAPFTIGVLGIGFSFLVLRMLDSGINADVHASYFDSEWFTWNILQWADKSGINDTHRSVVYMLFLVCVFVTLLLLLQALISLFSEKLRNIKFVDKFDNWTTLKLKWGDTSRNECIGIIMHVLAYLVNNVLVVVILLFVVGIIKGNFATAFITVIAIWGLARSLTNIDPKEGAVANILEMVLSSVIIIVVAFIPDHGYVTNYFGFFAAVVAFYVLMQKSILSTALTKKERDRREEEEKWIPRIGIGLLVFFFFLPFIYNLCKNPENVDYDRSSRRFMMTSQFEQYHESGYRYADSDVEFMKILFHYMESADGKDPLSNEKHELHPSISTGQSPVILNDVSLPGAFIGPYGWGAYAMYFVLLVLLIYIVVTYSLTGTTNGVTTVFDRYTQWRLLAMLMWVGTSLYLFLSYCGVLPFTGRLNPGFGVDAVGESLESAILLAFMTATTLKIERA